MKAESYKNILPKEVYEQILDICKSFHELHLEASGILHHSDVPGASAQLHDVLQSTEEATTAILDAASAIGQFAEEGNKEEIAKQVTRIFESCNFQDISGQRIKKVLKSLDILESRLRKLAETARDYTGAEAPAPIKKEEGLLNGPQLSSQAPTQDEIDKLFSNG